MKINRRDHGVVSILAMMFLVIFSSLAAAMAIVAQGNLQTAETYQRVNRSLAAAETGMKFAEYQVARIANTIRRSEGEVDANLADGIWDDLRDGLIDEAGGWMHFAAGDNPSYTVEENGERIILGRIPVGGESGAPTFQIILERHPLAGEDYGSDFYYREPYDIGTDDPDRENPFTRYSAYPEEPVSSANPIDRTWVRIRSIGRDGDYARSVQMDFRIDKKIRFALLSRNRIMIGRNVMIQGDIGSRYTRTEYTHGHPVQMRDNFHGMDVELNDWLDALEDYLANNDQDNDNRVWLEDDRESDNLANATEYERNGDGYVDAYDMFLLRYDGPDHGGNGDGAVSMSEFSSSGGGLIDEQLWRLINEMKYPPGTQFDWVNQSVKRPEDASWVDASADMSVINNGDQYAKIAGQIVLEATKEAWESGAAGGPYQKYLEDSIIPDPDDTALIFEADGGRLADFTPGDFDVSSYRTLATGSFDDQTVSPTANDSSQPVPEPTMTPEPEAVPFGSPHPYDYYERRVYENMVFEDVLIPKGTNALFKNCRFVGVTYIETESDNTDSNYNHAGMQNPDGSFKYPHVTATVDGQEITDPEGTKAHGNNIRFDNCTFEGMVASGSETGEAPRQYTHVRNKVQFTGQTRFDLEADSLTTEEKELFRKSTIMAPQYSVDMGTFDQPTAESEYVQLDGTIVTGVFDIRGQAVVDGSIITTYEPKPDEGPLSEGGNPANFNTTIGYFESAAGDGEGEMPDGGYGKILLRYDPTRALPDGINAPIEVRPDMRTYYEGGV